MNLHKKYIVVLCLSLGILFVALFFNNNRFFKIENHQSPEYEEILSQEDLFKIIITDGNRLRCDELSSKELSTMCNDYFQNQIESINIENLSTVESEPMTEEDFLSLVSSQNNHQQYMISNIEVSP